MSKKFLIAILAVLTAVFLSFSSMAVFAAGDAEIPGGVIEITDASEVNTGSSSVQKKAGDVDGNGEVNIDDVTVYQLTLAGRMDVTDAFNLNSETVTDTKRNITDATGIQYYVAGTFRKLPVTLDGYYSEIIRP